MARLTVESNDPIRPTIAPGVLMLHKESPPMVVIVDEALVDGLSFFGTDLESGVRIEYDADQFEPLVGKITLEQ